MEILDMSVPYSYSMKSSQTQKVIQGELVFERLLWMQTIAGLAYHPGIQEKIDTMYHNEESQFTIYLSVNFLETDSFFYSFPADIVIYMKKLSAIYQSLPQGENQKLLISLIKAGYKRYVDFSQDQKGIFSILQFSNSLIKRSEKGRVSEGHLNLVNGIILYYRFQQKLYKVYQDPICKVLLNNFAKDNEAIRSTHNLRSLRTKEIEQKGFQFYEKHIGKKIPRKQLIDDIMTAIEEKSYKTFLGKIGNKVVDNNLIYTKGINRYLKPLTSALYNQGFNEFYIWENIEYSREDYLEFFIQFERHVSLNRLKEEDFEMSFATHLILFVLVKQYQNVSNLFLKELQRNDNTVLEEQKKELLKNKKDFLKEKDQIVIENEQLLKRDLIYREEIQTLTKKIKELELKERDNEILKREVVSLREYVFTENNFEEVPEEDIEVSSIEKLQEMNLKIALFGGHVRFAQKMKETFPSIRTVSPDELNIDISFVNQMDIILFVTSYNNHSNYNRLQEALKAEGVMLYFINREKSIERIASSLLKKFQFI